MTKFYLKGGGEVELTQKEFIASGGEGKVYAKGKTAYKIYDNLADMIPVAKIQELSVLNHPNIIKPDRILLNSKNTACGYSMRLVQGAALCQLFTKSYRQRNNITNDMLLHLVKNLYDLVEYCHKNNILIVDLNELNYLVNQAFDEIYAIDVNSYQTPSFPATVIMPSVKDRHCKNKFTQGTDWFSWGIVTCQMMIGIHPYKGTHPDFDGMPLDERMEARMLKNISIFNPKTTIPKVCQPFDVIPPALRGWFKAVFEDGKRIIPPNDFVGGAIVIPVKITQLVGSNFFEIKEVETYISEILAFYAHQGNTLVLTDKKVYVNRRQFPIASNNARFVFTPKLNRPLAVYVENDELKILDIENQKFLPLAIYASAVMECNGNIFIKTHSDILELGFAELGNQIICSTKPVGQVLNACKVYDGVVIQDLLGSYYASIFPSSGRCNQVHLKELKPYSIADAKFVNNVLVVIGADRKSGKYDRFVFKFDANFEYDVRKVENVAYTGINFTVNDAGITILLTEDEKIEAFSNNKQSGSVKIVDDPSIESDMKLFHDGTKMLFAKGNKLYSIAMRKP